VNETHQQLVSANDNIQKTRKFSVDVSRPKVFGLEIQAEN
jgi:hypothetical protein